MHLQHTHRPWLTRYSNWVTWDVNPDLISFKWRRHTLHVWTDAVAPLYAWLSRRHARRMTARG
jgi:hypothetical protein